MDKAALYQNLQSHPFTLKVIFVIILNIILSSQKSLGTGSIPYNIARSKSETFDYINPHNKDSNSMFTTFSKASSLITLVGSTRKLGLAYLLTPLLSTFPTQCHAYKTPLRYSYHFSHNMETCVAYPTPVEHPKYDIVKHDLIEEYNITATLYQHKQTEAKLLSLLTPENELEKVFAIGFNTHPYDNTGSAHIVEHSVLCGSDKYPVKEPFVELIKGSLNTFLNAFTFPEATYYPVASTNTKDFYNLVDVYMDAVFHPRAMHDPDVLKQEGTRLSVQKSDNDGSSKEEIVYGGVVFNEMKATNNQKFYIIEVELLKTLYENSPYTFNYGGDPKYIRELTFEKFKSFYNKYYHPGNSHIVFWGSDDVYDRLSYVDNKFKDVSISSNSVKPEWKPQEYTGEPFHKVIPAPTTQGRLEDTLMIAWGLCTLPGQSEVMPYQELFEFDILNEIILGSSVSPLYQNLMKSKLGTAVAQDGLSSLFRRDTFRVGLHGLKQEEGVVEKVEKIIIDTITKCSEEGFSDMAIHSAINLLEFKMKECTRGLGLSKGMNMAVLSALEIAASQNPIDIWKFDHLFTELRAKLESGEPVFQNLIKKYLINNKHKAVLHFKAEETFIEKLNKEEEESLNAVKSKLSEEDFQEIKSQDIMLKERQAAPDSPEDLATIPILKLADLDKKNYEIPTQQVVIDGKTVLLHQLNTAGILYSSLCFDMNALSVDELVYLPLFCEMITKAGTDKLDEIELAHFIDLNTGGINASPTIYTKSAPMNKISDGMQAKGYLIVDGKATSGKIDKLFDLFSSVLNNTDFSNKKVGLERLKELLHAYESKVNHAGDSFGSKDISSTQTVAGYVENTMSGIPFVFTLRKMVKEAEEDWTTFQKKLEEIKSKLVVSNSLLINLTADEDTLNSIITSQDEKPSQISSLIKQFNENDKMVTLEEPKWATEVKENNMMQKYKSKGYAIDTQVNYVCFGGKMFDAGDEFSFGKASAFTLSTIFGHLWDSVRVLGGAYGVKFSFTRSGEFMFTSYRDPNFKKTLENYHEAPDAMTIKVDESGNIVGDEKFQEEVAKKILKSTISAIGKLDQPLNFQSQGKKAMWQFINGETPEERQKFRDEILSLTYQDFNKIAQQLKTALSDTAKTHLCTVASEEALKKYKEDNPEIEIVTVTEGQKANEDNNN